MYLASALWRQLTDPAFRGCFLAGIMTLRLGVLCVLYRAGFTSVSADEFSRGLMALEWARDPYLVIGKTHWPWLPFERYLHGSLLRLWEDPIWVPRITAFLASCALLLYCFNLVRVIWGGYFAATVSTLVVASFHWFVWLSATPMLEVYYVAASVAALFYGARWLAHRQLRDAWWSACALFIATGFHYQAWIVAAVVCLLSVATWPTLLRERDFRGFIGLLAGYGIVSAYVVFTLVTTYFETGTAISMFDDHAEYSKRYYSGYDIHWARKLFYYPHLVAKNTNPLLVPFFTAGVWVALRSGRRALAVMPLVVALLALSAFSLFNVVSVPSTAAPGRFSLVFFVLFAPYIGIGADAALRHATSAVTRPAIDGAVHLHRASACQGPRAYLRPLLGSAAALAAVGALLFSTVRTASFPPGMDRGAIRVGTELHKRLRAAPASNFLLEIAPWQFLGVALAASHPERMRWDRPFNLRRRDQPSLLEMDSAAVRARLEDDRIEYLALRSTKLVTLARPFAQPVFQSGTWTLLQVEPGAHGSGRPDVTLSSSGDVDVPGEHAGPGSHDGTRDRR